MQPSHPAFRSVQPHFLRNVFIVLFAILSLALPLLLFWPARHYGFIALDDGSYVLHNPLVAAGLSWKTFRQAFAFPGPAPMYIPVLWLSYMADATLFGAGPQFPAPFHLVNTALHALDTLLLFAFFFRLSKRPFSSFLLALLWALHPLRVESVAWIAERKDVLSLFFLLIALHAWMSFLSSKRPLARALCWSGTLLAFALGLLTKPSLVPLPFLLAFLALPPCATRIPALTPALPLKPSPLAALKSLFKSLWPFLLLSLVAARLSVITHAIDNDVIPVPFASRLLTIPSVVSFYLSKTLWPFRLALIYPSWISPPLRGMAGLALLLVMATAVFRLRRRFPFLWLGTLFSALFFAPVSGIVQVPFNLVADRFSYLPAIGLSIALLDIRPASRRSRTLVSGILVLLLVAESVLSFRHLPVWKNTRSIYATVRPLLPDHYAIRIHDAQEAFRRGRFDDALECLRRATAAAGRLESADVAAALPVVWARDGTEAALDFLQNAPIPPTDSLYHGWCLHLALANLALERFREALDIATAALPSIPLHNPYRESMRKVAMIAAHSLGLHSVALHYAGPLDSSLSGGTALSEPCFSSFYLSLWHDGFGYAALPYFRAVLRDYPSSESFNNVAWLSAVAFWSPVSPDETLAWAQRALELEGPDSPRRPGVLDTFAAALANTGRFDDAVSALSEALDATPPGHPSRPAMLRRLDLYRRHIPYREIRELPVPESEYDYPVDFPSPRGT